MIMFFRRLWCKTFKHWWKFADATIFRDRDMKQFRVRPGRTCKICKESQIQVEDKPFHMTSNKKRHWRTL